MDTLCNPNQHQLFKPYTLNPHYINITVITKMLQENLDATQSDCMPHLLTSSHG